MSVTAQGLYVPGPFPGMNEIIAAAKSGRGKGNAYSRMKSNWTGIVESYARRAKLKPIAVKAVVSCTWYEPDERRDPDNVAAAVKFVLDGLVAAGVLRGDGRKHVSIGAQHVDTDRTSPGVYVEIIGVVA